MAYATIQAIREAAGLQSRIENETPAGPVDGTNRVFVVKRKPIADANYDEVVDAEDVQVMAAGVTVEVESVNADTGEITLKTAPGVSVPVRVFYHFSPLTTQYVEGKQEEADSWVDMKVGGSVEVPILPAPAVISTAAELYAAGVILYKDWGNRSNTEYTTKDGDLKISQARKLIEEYLASLKQQRQANSSSSQAVSAVTDPNVFSRTPDNGSTFDESTNDSFFWNRKV